MAVSKSSVKLRNKIRLEKKMAPASEATKLESSGTFVEYVGSGKLKDKKALITGGEYVSSTGIIDQDGIIDLLVVRESADRSRS